MPEKFLEELVENYSNFFKEVHGREVYPNQDIVSCQALFDLCVKLSPDFVIDIGTNYGASTLTLAYALKTIGKPLSLLTTIDKSHGHWNEQTLSIQNALLKKEGLDMSKIKTVESDFSSLDPTQFLRKDVKGFIFYDIHDNNLYTFSDRFLLNWVPLLGESIVAIHDCSFVPESHILRENYNDYTMTKHTHFSGKTYAGFNECEPIIKWANEKRCDIFDVPYTSIIYFKFNAKRK